MNYGEVLQKYLYRIARGELKEVESVLPLIPPSVFFLGATKEVTSDILFKVTIPTVVRNGENLIPVFLTKSHLLSVNNNYEIQPIEVKGETLLLSLPKGFGLIIEPDTSLEVSFSADILNNNESKEEPDTTETSENISSLSKEVEEDLEISLINILDDYQEVSEAYLSFIKSSDSDCLLGILSGAIEEDRRFHLFEKIAALSNRIFGYASAIEVIDDLEDIHSSSWELFKRMLPFYIKSSELISSETEKLVSKLEISEDNSSRIPKNLDEYYNKNILDNSKEIEDDTNNDQISFSSLKNTGLKLLFGYTGKKH